MRRVYRESLSTKENVNLEGLMRTPRCKLSAFLTPGLAGIPMGDALGGMLPALPHHPTRTMTYSCD